MRIYLVNVIEFDPINSFHLHANFFDYYDQGTTLTPTLKTVDLIMQCQAQRGILEFSYREHEPGLYMFHAHQSEFTELGWIGMFDVVEAWHERGASDATGAGPLRAPRPRGALLSGLPCRWRCSAWRSRGSFAADPLGSFDNGAPPVENLTFERTMLDADGLRLLVRAGGSEPMTIAQVQVDDAYWQFTQEPAGPIARGVDGLDPLPFPWVLGEAHAVNDRHQHRRDLRPRDRRSRCRRRPTDRQALVAQALLGVFVGILPVAIGLMFYPALRGVGRDGMNFLLALTVGLLAFLLVDALEEALELAGEAAALFQGPAMVVLAGAGELPDADGGRPPRRRADRPRARDLHRARHRAAQSRRGSGDRRRLRGGRGRARHVPGAGLHAAQHHRRHRHRRADPQGAAAAAGFAGLALLAGGPAVLGLWIGSLAYAPQWSALALAIGAGAILQVIVEVGAYLMRADGRGAAALLSPPAASPGSPSASASCT